MNLGNTLNKVKQTADRLFLRSDKTDVLEDFREEEEKADELRILTESFYKSFEKLLNTHHVNEEKKYRKIPENQAADILKDALYDSQLNRTHNEQQEKTLFRGVVEEIIGADLLLGKTVLDYEDQVESEVLNPVHKLLKEDFPSLNKQKKALKQAGVDWNAAKARVRISVSNPSQTAKAESLKTELEESEIRLEQLRDSYACELFGTLGKQREIAKLCCSSLEMKLDFLQSSLDKLSTQLPPLRRWIDESMCGPIYSVPLHEHLTISQREIALPIEVCIKCVVAHGLKEEGVFRVAGSTNKIKRLKGAFDAGVITPAMLSSNDWMRDYDIHVVAGALKGYLRDLPEPLLTHIRHDQWIEATKISDHNERLKAMWHVVNSLPKSNFHNLSYLIQFLSLFSKHSADNKMTSNNLSIVIAPNLMWSQRELEENDAMSLEMNMSISNGYRNVVEQLIEYCDYFFKEKFQFGVPSPSPRVASKSHPNGTMVPNSSSTLSRTASHRRTGSSDLSLSGIDLSEGAESPKQPHRTKKKPAPKPPNQNASGNEDMFSSTYSLRNPPEPLVTQHGAQPLPAPRLHHTNSLRRPTVEPPRPPTIQASAFKPPRPSPPMTFNETEVDTTAKLHPIGFDRLLLQVDHETSSHNPDSSTTTQQSKNQQAAEIVQVELRESPAGASVEFRKSLEGVLAHPQAHPRHLNKVTSSGDTPALSEPENNPPERRPVPAQRTTKEITEKSDTHKPVLPEKPSQVNRIAGESGRPVVPEKPTMLASKMPITKNPGDCASSSAELESDGPVEVHPYQPISRCAADSLKSVKAQPTTSDSTILPSKDSTQL